MQTFNLCRDLLQTIKNIELEQREKQSATILINTESLLDHINDCKICSREFSELQKNLLPVLMKNLTKIF